MADPRVVYIGGTARSGTTVLGLLLGTTPDSLWAGELRHLPRDLCEDRRCTCGQPASRCPFWMEVGERLGGPRGWREARRQAWRDRLGRGVGAASVRAVAAVSGARTVIDTSKRAARAGGLIEAGLDVRLIRLTRDPAVLAARHARHRPRGEQRSASPPGLVLRDAEVAYRWARLARQHPVYVADWDALVADPSHLISLCAHAGLDHATLAGSLAHPLHASHVLTANRLRHGPVVLRPDEVQ